MTFFRWLTALAALASALPLLFLGEGGLDGFVAGLVVVQLAPFALLVALADRLSVVARWLALGVPLVLQALAYYEVFRPDQRDGQAALVFLFSPFYLTVLVLIVWIVDVLVQVLGRRIRR